MNHRLTLWIPGSGVPDLVLDQTSQGEDFIVRKPKGDHTFDGTTPSGGFVVGRGSVRYFDYDVLTVETEEKRIILRELFALQYDNSPGTATGGINFRDEVMRVNRDREITGLGVRQTPTSGDPEIDDPVLVAGINTSYFESRGMIQTVDDAEEFRGWDADNIFSKLVFRLVEFT